MINWLDATQVAINLRRRLDFQGAIDDGKEREADRQTR
jgi:hypothetical protein